MADVAALVKQLQDEQVSVRAAAAEQLCQMGEDARTAASALVRATGDDDSVSQWAVAALEELGPPDAVAADELARLTTIDHELVAYWATTLLGRLGSAARCAEDSLVMALTSSPHQAVRQRAAWALGKIEAQSPEAIEALRQASQVSEPRLARLATRALEACD